MLTIHSFRTTAFLMGLTVIAGGCAGEEAGPQGSSALQIPLSQPAPDGMSTYFLRDATFHITNASGVDLMVDGGGDDQTLVVPLDPGLYDVRLVDGWHMERVVPGQPPEAAPALLASHNPAPVLVFAEFPAYVSFQFLLGSTEGPLNITFGVYESWAAAGNMYVTTNEPQPGSTGAFAEVPAGSFLGMAIHFPQDQLINFEMPDGSHLRQIGMSPLAASFFGAEIFEDHVGPSFAGSYANLQITVDATGTCSMADTTIYSITGSDSVFYVLLLTGGTVCSGGLDAEGYMQIHHMSLSPQFELQRYETGVLTDRLTGTMSLIFSAPPPPPVGP
jgi:hypothetical protein